MASVRKKFDSASESTFLESQIVEVLSALGNPGGSDRHRALKRELRSLLRAGQRVRLLRPGPADDGEPVRRAEPLGSAQLRR